MVCKHVTKNKQSVNMMHMVGVCVILIYMHIKTLPYLFIFISVYIRPGSFILKGSFSPVKSSWSFPHINFIWQEKKSGQKTSSTDLTTWIQIKVSSPTKRWWSNGYNSHIGWYMKIWKHHHHHHLLILFAGNQRVGKECQVAPKYSIWSVGYQIFQW